MAGIKILDYATDCQAKAQALVTSAQAAMADAQDKLATAIKNRDQAAKDVADLAQEMAGLRAQLKNIVVPADAQPLIVQLTSDMTAMRGKQEALLDANEDLLYRQRGITRASAQIAAAAAVLASANVGLTTAKADAASRQSLRDAITQPPLDTMKADAAAAMAGLEFTDAQGKLRGHDIPNELFDRAIQRGDEAAAVVDATRTHANWAENVMNEALDATQGQSGAVASAKTTFTRSRDAFETYVATAKQRYDQALGLLTSIPGGPSPSTAEQAQISDATKQADRDAALTNEKSVADNQAAYGAAQASVDLATWEAIRTNPDADPSTDTNVKTAVSYRDTTIKPKLDAATAAFTPAMQSTLDEWQTDVPDSTWMLVSNFQVANAILTDLSNTDPTQLQTQMDADELPYGQALSDQAQSERAALLLANAIQDSADWRDAMSRTEAETISTAVRGSA